MLPRLPSLLPALLVLCAALLSLGGRAEIATDGSAPQYAPPTAEQLQAYRNEARDRGFLWRIEKDGRSSYLYGTVHVGKLQWMFPGPVLLQALGETDRLALELDMLDPDIQQRIAAALGKQRRSELPAPLQERIRRQAKASRLPYAALAEMSPELQVVTLTIMVARHHGLDPAYAMDVMLAGFGHQSRRPVTSLETPELQLQALHMGSARETRDFVDASLQALESGQAARTLVRLSRIWEESDYAAMEDYPAWCNCMETPVERKAMKRLLNARNPALAKGIDALHRQGGRVFAAVGSLHLFGPQGLPRLMQNKGYKVQRVDFPRPE